MAIFAAVKFNVMKRLKTTVFILLNFLFCASLLWFFSRNAFLRPSTGNLSKEAVSGLLLLGSLYLNYYLLYPKLYLRGYHNIYWLTLVLVVLATGFTELALVYSNLVSCSSHIIHIVGPFSFFSETLFLIVLRNLAFNLFAYVLRERKQLQQTLETEVKVVYQFARMLDVCDNKNNCQHPSPSHWTPKEPLRLQPPSMNICMLTLKRKTSYSRKSKKKKAKRSVCSTERKARCRIQLHQRASRLPIHGTHFPHLLFADHHGSLPF